MENGKWVFAIVDTCFLLEHSHKLELILKYINDNIYNEPSLSAIRFIIPFIVFQELDNLNKSWNGSLSPRAMNAMKWMQYSLTSGLQIHAQTMVETYLNASTMKMKNDDKILNCALYYGCNIGRECRVILLTMDRNLILKGIAHSINSLGSFSQSPQSSIKEIIERSTYIVYNENRMHLSQDDLDVNMINILRLNTDCIKISKQLELISRSVENSTLESNLKSILDKNIGPEWKFLIAELPKSGEKWSFKFMLGVLSKYWISGFKKSLPSKTKILIDEIIESCKRLEIIVENESQNYSNFMMDFNECTILATKISNLMFLFGIVLELNID